MLAGNDRRVEEPHHSNLVCRDGHPDTRSFAIIHFDGQSFNTLVPRRPSAAIRPDNDWNHLEVSCMGQTFTARANGEDLVSMQNGAQARGGWFIGVSGPASAMPKAEARFDNLVIYGP